MNKSSFYYLSAETCSQKMISFRAVFTETCEIKHCYIIASSLHHAMFILYEKLSPIWTKGFLDNHLLKLEFHETIYC